MPDRTTEKIHFYLVINRHTGRPNVIIGISIILVDISRYTETHGL